MSEKITKVRRSRLIRLPRIWRSKRPAQNKINNDDPEIDPVESFRQGWQEVMEDNTSPLDDVLRRLDEDGGIPRI